MTKGPKISDAFGALLLAALAVDGQPNSVFEVVEREDGHVRVNDAARYFRASWGQLDDWAYERVHGQVLDVGCGAGRHALTLQDRGVPVVGLDPSPGAIEVCRRRGVHHLIHGTLEAVTSRGGFGTVFLMGNNLGLLASREQSAPFLGHLAELSAGPGSRILASGIGVEPGASSGNTADAEYMRSNQALGRLPWQVTMRSRFGNLATDWFDYLFLRLPDLAELVADSPWQIVDHLHEGSSYVVQLELRHVP